MLTKVKTLQNFQELINTTEKRIENTLKVGKPIWDGFEVWKTACSNAIEIVFTTQHRNFVEFQNIRYSGDPGSTPTQNYLSHVIGLQIAKEKLGGMLYTISLWFDEDDAATDPIQPIAFIAHDSSTPKLQLLEDFLVALSVQPIVVEKLPDAGLTVSEKVRFYMSKCNVGIAFITKAGTMKETGEVRGRPNIDHEIGMMMNSPNIGRKLIVLKQDGVTLPSNYDDLVYSVFTKKSLEKSFIDIVKNLRAFGFFY